MGPIFCPETSVRNDHSTQLKIPKRAQISFTRRWKLDITRVLVLNYINYTVVKVSLNKLINLLPNKLRRLGVCVV